MAIPTRFFLRNTKPEHVHNGAFAVHGIACSNNANGVFPEIVTDPLDATKKCLRLRSTEEAAGTTSDSLQTITLEQSVSEFWLEYPRYGFNHGHATSDNQIRGFVASDGTNRGCSIKHRATTAAPVTNSVGGDAATSPNWTTPLVKNTAKRIRIGFVITDEGAGVAHATATAKIHNGTSWDTVLNASATAAFALIDGTVNQLINRCLASTTLAGASSGNKDILIRGPFKAESEAGLDAIVDWDKANLYILPAFSNSDPTKIDVELAFYHDPDYWGATAAGGDRVRYKHRLVGEGSYTNHATIAISTSVDSVTRKIITGLLELSDYEFQVEVWNGDPAGAGVLVYTSNTATLTTASAASGTPTVLHAVAGGCQHHTASRTPHRIFDEINEIPVIHFFHHHGDLIYFVLGGEPRSWYRAALIDDPLFKAVIQRCPMTADPDDRDIGGDNSHSGNLDTDAVNAHAEFVEPTNNIPVGTGYGKVQYTADTMILHVDGRSKRDFTPGLETWLGDDLQDYIDVITACTKRTVYFCITEPTAKGYNSLGSPDGPAHPDFDGNGLIEWIQLMNAVRDNNTIRLAFGTSADSHLSSVVADYLDESGGKYKFEATCVFSFDQRGAGILDAVASNVLFVDQQAAFEWAQSAIHVFWNEASPKVTLEILAIDPDSAYAATEFFGLPTVTITQPTSAATYETSAASIQVEGTGEDFFGGGLTGSITNDATAQNDDLEIAGPPYTFSNVVALALGVNVITVTVSDQEQVEPPNSGTDVLTVTRVAAGGGGSGPPRGSMSMMGLGR